MAIAQEERVARYLGALRDFHKMRRRADLERLLARLRGQSADLLAYDEVRAQLRARGSVDLGEKDIPLDAIVGSVNRHTDFSRSFLPRRDSDANRWAKVDLAVTGELGLEPIDVYRIGEAYFVLDGNHRVSVARWLGATHIAANVVEVRTLLPLCADDSPDDLILKARLGDFLEKTRLDDYADPSELAMTSPGGYRVLLEDIEIAQHYLSKDAGKPVPLDDAAHHWFFERYQPTVALMRERGMLYHFPQRTEADLFVWIVKHQHELTDVLQWHVDVDMVIADLDRRLGGAEESEILLPDAAPFRRVLVPMSKSDVTLHALKQAIVIAQRSGGKLYGLHVHTAGDADESAEWSRERFEGACREAGVDCEFALADGPIARMICDRARWADLVVTGVSHPPAPQVTARLRSGFGAVVRRCSRPILAVPPVASALGAPLVAYDGSAKARQALALAAYLAGEWSVSLAVVVVQNDAATADRLIKEVDRYLAAYAIQASCVHREGDTVLAILAAAEDTGADLIMMGGYGRGALIEVALGSTVDGVVRAQRYPVLICH